MILKQGNLFDTECKIIAHGVNCKGGFGSGVAGQIARLFPFVKEEYFRKFQVEGWKLGDVQFVVCGDKIIANCATQFNYGRTGVYVDYDAIGNCLNKVFDFAHGCQAGVAIPWIGCGLAGGNRGLVSTIIQQVQQERKIYLEVWEL